MTWAFILVVSSKENKARSFLGLFMFVVSLIFVSHSIYYHHLKDIYLYFDLVFIVGSLSIFPVYHWYIKLLTFKSKIDWKDLILLAPAAAMLVATIVTYLLMPTEMRAVYVSNYLYGNGSIAAAPLLIKVQLGLCYTLQLVYFLQIIFSFLKVRVLVKNYNENIANFYSNLENKTLHWPKIILDTFVITSLFTILTNFLGRSFFDKWPLMLFVTCMSYSIFLFVLGYLGYMQNHTVDTFEKDKAFLQEVVNENPSVEYTNNKKIKDQLLQLFETEQVYKRSDLKITDIVAQLNTNRTYISTLINQEYACSFSTFVNQYRVEEAKIALLNEDNKNFSIEHIATLVGFGSSDSFRRVFKDTTGITPKNYRETTPRP
jgi:AraC-like DNA-binding protein